MKSILFVWIMSLIGSAVVLIFRVCPAGGDLSCVIDRAVNVIGILLVGIGMLLVGLLFKNNE